MDEAKNKNLYDHKFSRTLSFSNPRRRDPQRCQRTRRLEAQSLCLSYEKDIARMLFYEGLIN